MNFNKFLFNIIKYTVYLSLFTPLIFHKSFLFPFVVPKTVFFWITVEVIFFTWILLAVWDKQFRPRKNVLFYAVLVFLLIMMMASFRGVNIRQSFWGPMERMGGVITFMHLGAYFLALFSTFKTNEEWKGIFRVVVFVGVLVAGIFLLQNLAHYGIFPQTRQGATLGNSSFMGAYLLFPAFISLYLFFDTKILALLGRDTGILRYSLILKVLYGLSFIIISFTLFRSTAWGALLSFLGGLFLIFLFWLYLRNNSIFNINTRIIAVIFFILLIIISSIVFYATFWQVEAITGYLPSFFSSQTIAGRSAVWQIAWQGVKERPVLGWGPENFPAVFSRYYNPCLGLAKCGLDTLYDRTHNIVFDMLIFGGFAGLFSYLALFGAAFYLLYKKTLRAVNIYTNRRENWLMPAVMGALLISYFVQNLMVFDMIGTYMMFFLVLAFISSINTKTP